MCNISMAKHKGFYSSSAGKYISKKEFLSVGKGKKFESGGMFGTFDKKGKLVARSLVNIRI